ncbi:MAG: glycosyltransferase [Candidatus Sericytochromatia bacterium]|nr:glycosyltransferase [Candidatus Sericytochromatia bacterium]
MIHPRAPQALRLLVALPLALMLGLVGLVLASGDTSALTAVMLVPLAYGVTVFTLGAWWYGRPDPSVALPEEDTCEWPMVSIMVPAHNEEAVIGHTLAHLLRLDYPRFEVIVIDDHSHDRTSEVVQQFAGVKLVQRRNLPNRGKSEALNAGLEFASGEVVCVFDADSEVAPDFLRRAVAPLIDNPEYCGVQAQVRMYNRHENLLTQAQDDEFALFNEILQVARGRLGIASALGGNGQLTKRSALEAVGGWNPGSLTEDLDLTMRLLLAGRGRIYHVTDAVVWQEGVTTLRGLIRQRQRWAEGMLRTYGEFILETLRSRELTSGLRLDAVYALVSCFFPLLTVAGLVVQVLGWFPGVITHGLPGWVGNGVSALLLAGALGWSTVVSWKRDRRIDVRPGLRYMVYVLHWVPAVLIAVRNVFSDRAVVWAKTEHRGQGLALPAMPAVATPVGAGRDG